MFQLGRPVGYPTVGGTGQRATNEPKSEGGEHGLNWVLAVPLIVALSGVALLIDARLIHWFMAPVSVCGILVAVDCVEWARGQLQIFEPRALVGLFGFHFFYLAPILHVCLDYWALYIPGLADWRHGLGLMATHNVGGLLAYRFVVALPSKSPYSSPSRVLRLSSFRILGTFATLVGIMAFVGILAYYGGVQGYLRVVTTARDEPKGMGLFLLVAEAFPLLAFATVLMSSRHRLRAHPSQLLTVSVLFAVVQFFAAGLRGSRSNTIWPLLIAIILVHLIVRPVTKRAFLALVSAVGIFMFMYSFYKIEGTDALPELRSGDISSLSASSGRGVSDLLLGDLGRSDIQALVLLRQAERHIDPVIGQTYVAGVTFFLPSSAWGSHAPESKVQAGTEVLYGVGTFDSGFSSTRNYGLAGEGILNFGWIGGPLMFIAFGFYVREATRMYRKAGNGEDLRAKLLAPGLAVGAILVLGQDSGNVVFFLLRDVVPLALVTWLGSRTRRGGAAHIGQAHCSQGIHRSGSRVHAAE